MNKRLNINPNISTPIYTQILAKVEQNIINSEYTEGTPLPSMNSLAEELGISKETVKKAYLILKERGMVEARQGKGFYVKGSVQDRYKRFIFIFDRLDSAKQEIIRNHVDEMDDCIDVTIRIHNNSPYILGRIIMEELGRYDCYIATAPSGQEKDSKRLRTLLKRIPSSRLILI